MRQKKGISALLIVSVVTMFALSAFAVPEPVTSSTAKETIESLSLEAFQSDLTGTLTGTGVLLVNGNVVQTGATVISGSIIATAMDGDAMLDLGTLGLIKLRPATEIRLTLAQGRVEIELRRCGSFTQTVPAGATTNVTFTNTQIIQVAPTTGEVKVRGQLVVSDDNNAPPPNTAAPGQMEEITLRAGESRAFDKIENLSATGEAIYTVNCVDDQSAQGGGGGVGFLPYTLLAAAGAATGLILGLNDSTEERPSVTPIR